MPRRPKLRNGSPSGVSLEGRYSTSLARCLRSSPMAATRLDNLRRAPHDTWSGQRAFCVAVTIPNGVLVRVGKPEADFCIPYARQSGVSRANCLVVSKPLSCGRTKSPQHTDTCSLGPSRKTTRPRSVTPADCGLGVGQACGKHAPGGSRRSHFCSQGVRGTYACTFLDRQQVVRS
jgi:hypothetical protein